MKVTRRIGKLIALEGRPWKCGTVSVRGWWCGMVEVPVFNRCGSNRKVCVIQPKQKPDIALVAARLMSRRAGEASQAA
jgi:hypothetical protein